MHDADSVDEECPDARKRREAVRDTESSRLGTMVSGGGLYGLDAVAGLSDDRRHSCGYGPLDKVTGGGLMPGAVWTLAATAGLGATSFAVQCAVAACRTGRVVLVNGHLASHLLARQIIDCAERQGIGAAARQRIEIASWLGLPDPSAKDVWAAMPLPGQDVLIVDTLDEMWRPPEWRRTRKLQLMHLRWLREQAQTYGTSVLLTARVASSWYDFDDAWRRHWAYAPFSDVSDVRLQITGGAEGTRLNSYVRGGRAYSGPIGSWISQHSLGRDDAATVTRPEGR